MVEHATENRSVRSPILRLGTVTVHVAVESLSHPQIYGKGEAFAMRDSKLNTAILQIFTGTVRNVVTSFLVERRSRGLSKSTLWYYTRYLNEFCEYLDEVGVINLEELTADVIRKYLLNLEGQGHNPGGVHGYFRCIRALLTWWEEETDGEYRSPMHKVKPPKVQVQPLPGVPPALDSYENLVDPLGKWRL